MEDLFEQNVKKKAPLADRMRPRTLGEFTGQEHIVGRGKLLRRAIETDSLTSSIFFGPPGSGKTALAYVIANTTGAAFEKLNAVTSGVKDVRAIIDEAQSRLKLYGKPTYLLLDECHRWSKTQSDSILPALEAGTIRFIGSTTENPMVSMTSAIVSRCRLFQFFALTKDDVLEIMDKALSDKERGFGNLDIDIGPEALEHIANVANGDARSALNAIELAVLTTAPDKDGVIRIGLGIAEESIQRRAVRCDDEEYYNMLSAFCKSLRGSDSSAALFWFARLNIRRGRPEDHCKAHNSACERGRRTRESVRDGAGRSRGAGAGVRRDARGEAVHSSGHHIHMRIAQIQLGSNGDRRGVLGTPKMRIRYRCPCIFGIPVITGAKSLGNGQRV